MSVQLETQYITDYTTPEDAMREFKSKNVELIDPRNPPAWARNDNGGFNLIPPQLVEQGLAPDVPKYGITADKSIGYVPQTYKIHLASGMTTMQGVLYKEHVRKMIYKATNETSIGLKVCHMETFPSFEASWLMPNSLTFEYPFAIEGGIPDVQTMTFWGYKMGLKRGGMMYEISDAARATQNIPMLEEMIRLRQAEAIRKAVDDNILPTLYAGAYGSALRDVPANFKWDASAANQPNIIDDIAYAQSQLFDQSDLSEAEIETERMKLVLPITAKPFLNSKPNIVQGGTTASGIAVDGSQMVIQRLNDMGVDVFYTRNSTFDNDGMICYMGPKIAIHGVYGGSEIPLMEQERQFGLSTRVAIWRFYNTKVGPYATGQTTNKNIGKITDLFAD